ISYLPRNLQDLADLLAGSAFHKVGRFVIFGPGASSFQPEFEVHWLADKSPFADYSAVPRGSRPELVSVVSDPPGRQGRSVTIPGRDAGGYRGLRSVEIIANETRTTAGACYLRYQPANHILWMMDSSGTGSTGLGLIGSLQVLENAKCSVNL